MARFSRNIHRYCWILKPVLAVPCPILFIQRQLRWLHDDCFLRRHSQQWKNTDWRCRQSRIRGIRDERDYGVYKEEEKRYQKLGLQHIGQQCRSQHSHRQLKGKHNWWRRWGRIRWCYDDKKCAHNEHKPDKLGLWNGGLQLFRWRRRRRIDWRVKFRKW